MTGQHHTPIRYLSRDSSIAGWQHRRTGDFTAVSPFPFRSPAKRAVLVCDFVPMSKLSLAQVAESAAANSVRPVRGNLLLSSATMFLKVRVLLLDLSRLSHSWCSDNGPRALSDPNTRISSTLFDLGIFPRE